jgi:hypothetical protein
MCRDAGSRRFGLLLCRALIIDALLGILGVALVRSTTLFVGHYVVAQFAIGTEQTAVSHYKFRFLFFFCHSFTC